MGYLTLTTPLSEKIFFGRVGRAMVSQCTKYEVSRFTDYEAVNGSAKCRKWGWLGGTQGQRQCHYLMSAYDFLFDFNRNYASIFYRFRDIAGYLWKVADFDPTPPSFGALVGVTPVEFRRDLWRQKTRIPGLSCVFIYVILRSAVLVELRLVTDTDRHRQTDRHRPMGHG